MPITLGSNIASLKAQRSLSQGTSQLSSTFEKLSSGLRINNASDDAAGLAIAESLNSDRRVFNQGIRNLNDGQSLLNIADGATEQLSGIVTRLKELAEQGANGTYSAIQREALDKEAQSLSDEYTRIIQTTSFNGRNLFSTAFGKLSLQAGYGNSGTVQSGLGGTAELGTFGASVTYTSAPGFELMNDIASGDLNNDGIADMVTVGNNGAGAATIKINLGTGNGSFSATISLSAAGTDSRRVALSDFNNDGILDIATLGLNAGLPVLSTRLGNGDGTFQASISANFSTSGVTSFEIADFDGDGLVDVVTTSANGVTSGASFRRGLGNGAFGSEVISLDPAAPESYGYNDIASGDINGDGILDIAMAGWNGEVGGLINIKYGRGDGTFIQGAIDETLVVATPTFGALNVELADVNSDGKLDVVTVDELNYRGYMVVRLQRQNGDFSVQDVYDNSADFNIASGDIKLADVNADGILDAVASGANAGSRAVTSVRYGSGTGTFGAALSYTTPAINTNSRSKLVVADLNNDGAEDVANLLRNSPGTFEVRLANTTDGIAPLLSFNLSTRAGALQAISQFDQALTRLSAQKSVIGAFQSRVSIATNNLQSASENYAAAASRIKDVDVAQESANLVRLRILQQASVAVLSQANQQPSLALKLLS